jgi:hypothetical protein
MINIISSIEKQGFDSNNVISSDNEIIIDRNGVGTHTTQRYISVHVPLCVPYAYRGCSGRPGSLLTVSNSCHFRFALLVSIYHFFIYARYKRYVKILEKNQSVLESSIPPRSRKITLRDLDNPVGHYYGSHRLVLTHSHRFLSLYKA